LGGKRRNLRKLPFEGGDKFGVPASAAAGRASATRSADAQRSRSTGRDVSILKFIETNWALPPLSKRSRDHLPNPIEDRANPYVTANRPAIGDLRSLFQF
jgi:hypothetical protein